jgi:2-dehydropantoate 2-reductase
MKYAILGAGAMGSIIGATLAKAGQEVVLINRHQDHVDKINRDGLKLTLGQTGETVRVAACADPAAAGRADVVVLLVKSFASEAALRGAAGLFGENTLVCSLQNGLGNAETIANLFPRDKILHGVIRVAGRLDGPGEVSGEIGAAVAVYLGSLIKEGAAAAAGRTMAGHLTAGGLAACCEDDVDKYIWDKAVINVCANAGCALARLRVRDYFGHPEGRRIIEDTAREAIAVADALGVSLDYDAIMADIAAALPIVGGHYPSMAQDMRAKRKTEIDTLNGAIVRYGRQLGIPTPANDYITRFIKIVEDNYDVQF